MHVQYFHVSSLFAKSGRLAATVPYQPKMLYSIVAVTGMGFRERRYHLVKIPMVARTGASQAELQATSSWAGSGLLIRYP
jgi:hypothetical protein